MDIDYRKIENINTIFLVNEVGKINKTIVLSEIFGIRLRNLNAKEIRIISARINYDLEQLFIKIEKDNKSLERIVTINNASDIYDKILNNWQEKNSKGKKVNKERLENELKTILRVKQLKEFINRCYKELNKIIKYNYDYRSDILHGNFNKLETDIKNIAKLSFVKQKLQQYQKERIDIYENNINNILDINSILLKDIFKMIFIYLSNNVDQIEKIKRG